VLAAALAVGVQDVTVSEPRADRRAAAQRLGARAISPDELSELNSVDCVIDTSGSSAAISAAAPVVKAGGKIVPVGLGDRAVPWPVGAASIVASFAYKEADFALAVQHIVSGRVRLGSFITHRFPLGETGRAIKASADDSSVVKAVVMPGPSAIRGSR
jgi:threonine dehydrogenase-like Zn-dependent dehydrogenase